MAKTSSNAKETTVKKAKDIDAKEQRVVGEEKTAEKDSLEDITKSALSKPVKIPKDALIPLRNATMGQLVYGSSRQMGYTIVWSEPNAVQTVEFSELMSMRNTDRKFFTENWLLIEDDEFTAEQVMRQLNILTYYKNYIDTEKLDEFFELPTDELVERIGTLSDGQKNTVLHKAIELYKDEKLTDLRKIRALEKILGEEIMVE